MNYSETIEYIHSINWNTCLPGLERIKKLCEKIGNPQESLKFIHVAGTNGKGSFCSMMESILRNAGYKTGMFTSPYVRHFNERIQFCGQNITEKELCEIVEYIKPIADEMEEKPTEFELITAIGFEYFKRKKCDIVVLEVGMGGRLDSTNIITTPVLSVITGIALDHTAFLGSTISEIAFEKSGIIKEGIPVIYGGENKEAYDVIKKVAEEKKSKCYLVDYSALNIKNATHNGTKFDFNGRNNLFIKLLGEYQPRNASLVISAVDILIKQGFKITEENIYNGLANATWHARFEIIKNDPLVIFDGGHNPEGVLVAKKSIEMYFSGNKVYILSGVMKDKDYTEIVSSLSSVTREVFCVRPDNPRSLDPVEYAKIWKNFGINADAYEDLQKALENALKKAKKDNIPLICLGSLYLYSSLMDEIEKI